MAVKVELRSVMLFLKEANSALRALIWAVRFLICACNAAI